MSRLLNAEVASFSTGADGMLRLAPTSLILANRSRTVASMIDARKLLESLQGRKIYTVTGRENRVLGLDRDHVIVWTMRSPAGQAVPIAWVEDAVERLERDGEIEVSVASLRYRSAFIGAVLLQLPGATAIRTTPPRVRLSR